MKAAASLGKISGPVAARNLKRALNKAHPSVRASVADACPGCAERLNAQGDAKEASALYNALQAINLPEYIKAANFEN